MPVAVCGVQAARTSKSGPKTEFERRHAWTEAHTSRHRTEYSRGRRGEDEEAYGVRPLKSRIRQTDQSSHWVKMAQTGHKNPKMQG